MTSTQQIPSRPAAATSAGGIAEPSVHVTVEGVLHLLEKRSFATLATTSPAGFPHAAGVLYDTAGSTFYVSTSAPSRKARNVAENPRVALCIPVRRLPVGPPSSVQLQATAEVLAVDDPDLLSLVAAGELKGVTSHGELELPEGCFLRITPNGRLTTYGLGLSLRRLIKDPLAAGGHVDLPTSA